jgi:hypothetical protein
MPQTWPALTDERFPQTRAGLHAFAKLPGVYASALAPRRRHWWHISLKPTAGGFSSGVLASSGQLFELTLNFQRLEIELSIAGEARQAFSLHDQTALSMRQQVDAALARQAIAVDLDENRISPAGHAIDPDGAHALGRVYGQLAQSFARFRATLAVETSPIQLWPHHFDLAMLVLPGRKIPGQDPDNEELSDEQLNFGFVPGDEGISEPYFFITHYAQAGRLTEVTLPEEARLHTEGWSGIVLDYETFRNAPEPETLLTDLWKSVWKVTGRADEERP